MVINGLKMFFATDIHGSEICFKKFIAAGKFYKADVMILGGDITFKAIVPIIRLEDRRLKYKLFGNVKISDENDFVEIEKRMRDNGIYPFKTDEKEFETIVRNQDRVNGLFEKLVSKNIEGWVKYADQKLKGSVIRCFINLGNDDPDSVKSILERSAVIEVPDDKIVRVDEFHEMISLGYSNPTPWKTYRELSEEQIEKKLETMLNTVSNIRNCIFNIHVPPYNSKLDECVILDTELNPKTEMGNPVVKPMGSVSVRKCIEKHQPLLGLFGHIHEARGISRIGKTLCVNPGSAYQEGVLQGCLVNLGKEGIISYQLTSG